jgi:chorismate dehydratase
MIRISAVSYLNTLPFIYGIENSGFINASEYILSRDIPSLCAQKLETHEADLVLTPVAAIANMKNIKIETDFCIGAKRQVKSVLLVGQKPMNELTDIYLDNQSRTSVTLVKVLAEKFWKKEFQWLKANSGYEKKIKENIGGVIIGDRALLLYDSFKYKYDLACEWNDFTGLPFVFACWASQNNISADFISRFNKALAWGIDHINEIKPDYPSLSNEYIREYYINNIDYPLNSQKRESIELFFSHMKSL